MSIRKKSKLVNMTSTQIFMNQVDNIYGKLRHENGGDPDVTFKPIHMGGLPGQRNILVGKNVMRETTVVN